MKSPITETEMQQNLSAGTSVLVAFRKAYQIVYSHGTSCHVLQPIPGTKAGLPYTPRGRFTLVSPSHFQALQNY